MVIARGMKEGEMAGWRGGGEDGDGGGEGISCP